MVDSSPLTNYLVDTVGSDKIPNPGFIAYLASLEEVSAVSPKIALSIVSELADQRANLKMIASENYSSLAVQLAQSNLFTDKYAEGFPYHRFYAGCDNVDEIEALAVKLAIEIFNADHAYVQPHSGADANLVAYWAILAARVQAPFMENLGQKDPSALSDGDWAELRSLLGNQRLLGMDYYSGGHLTHGYRHNLSSRMFCAESYNVDRDSGFIDYDRVREHALAFRPLILLAGYSAYPRHIDFKIFREIADEVGAVLMVDMAHFAGLVAGKIFTGDHDPVAHADMVTSTTHKTMRGPRGGMILCKQEFAEYVDKGCPLVLGGPLPHVIAAKAVAFEEANTHDFREYASHIVKNASVLASHCIDQGMDLQTGGTDNHLMLLNVSSLGLTGRQAESVLREARITLNRNTIPFDPNGPWYTSGLRMGTPALTTLGMGEEEMKEIANIIKTVLFNTKPAEITAGKRIGDISRVRHTTNPGVLQDAQLQVGELVRRFPVYPQLDLEYLQRAFM